MLPVTTHGSMGSICDPNKNSITNFIPIDDSSLSNLGLNLEESSSMPVLGTEEWKTIPLKEALVDVINQINAIIKKKIEKGEFEKGNTRVLLNTNRTNVQYYKNMPYPEDNESWIVSEEEAKKLWLRRIIDSLIKKEHVAEIITINGHGYFLRV